jgi:two-component system cell cycle sensor histidine kinase/response regulator CckA
MMSAIAQLRPNRSGSPDPALVTAAFQALPESLAIVASTSGLIVHANPACCEMFECSDPAQILGRPLDEIVPGHGQPAGPAAVTNDERDHAGSHFDHIRRDGSRQCIELTRTAFRRRSGEFHVVLMRDVTRQKQIERQLDDAQGLEAVGRLVGGVAHDFNNLLTGIMLYCDLLIGELEKDSRQHRHVQEMRTAGEHGAALVQQLLAVAQPRAEEARVFALNDIVTGIEDLVTRLIGENIVLTMSLAADLGAVRMDPSQVQQILLNLVLNARDAMPNGGQVTLATRNFTGVMDSAWVELSVTDTGDGMDADTLERAFEPFFTTKKTGRGNGLGLATARRLARQQGGTIVAESGPGKGTRVCVLLPRVPADTPLILKAEVIP